MCGIVGIAGDISPDARKVFQQMLVVDQLRGDHSTGVLSVQNYNGQVKISKAVGGPENLFETKKFQDQITDTSRLLLGHNRWATTGKVNVQNCHPFDFDNVVGVHNGSLRQYTRLPGYNEFNVDSQVLYHSINEQGIEETLDNIVGAYALVWYDKNEEKLKFIRNSERPLFFALTPDAKTLLWASEAWMIEAITARNGYKIDEVWNLKIDTLMEVDLKGAVRGKLDIDVTQGMKGGAAIPPAAPFRQPATSGGNSTNRGTESGTVASTSLVVSQAQSNSQGEKKTEEAATPSHEIINKDITDFIAGFKGCDKNGGKYVNLIRTSEIDVKYRLYLNPEDNGKITSGDRISGKVRGVLVEDGQIIYKILHSSYVNHGEEDKKPANNVVQLRVAELNKSLENLPEVLEGEQEEVFEDDKGRYLSATLFKSRYQFCDYCTGNIDPELGYRFIKDQILCDGCASDKVLVDSLI